MVQVSDRCLELASDRCLSVEWLGLREDAETTGLSDVGRPLVGAMRGRRSVRLRVACEFAEAFEWTVEEPLRGLRDAELRVASSLRLAGSTKQVEKKTWTVWHPKSGKSTLFTNYVDPES